MDTENLNADGFYNFESPLTKSGGKLTSPAVFWVIFPPRAPPPGPWVRGGGRVFGQLDRGAELDQRPVAPRYPA